MKIFDTAYEIPLVDKGNGVYRLSHGVLFWRDTVEITPAKNKIVFVKKGFWGEKRKTGKVKDTYLSVHGVDMGGPSYNLRFGSGVTIVLEDMRIELARQYGAEYIDQYIERLIESLGVECRIERGA